MYSVTIYRTKYCVYLHKAEGKVFYVGRGKADRPFTWDSRNRKWSAYVSQLDSYEVEVCLLTDDLEEATAEEIRLIRTLQPACNHLRYAPVKEEDWEPGREGPDLVALRIPREQMQKLEVMAALKREKPYHTLTRIIDAAFEQVGGLKIGAFGVNQEGT